MHWLVCLACALALLTASVRAGPKLDTSDPLGFFTNLSSRLLQSELNLNLTQIQIYPTNQYTPSVHRLLQVTANILDAATNRFGTNYPYFPSVLRPVFTNQAGNVYINGFVDETNTLFLTNTLRDISDASSAASVRRDGLVFGVPPVIGAKKGFPNFNEFAMQSVVQVTRKLEVVRSSFSAPQSEWRTNMMFVLGISNVLGVEMWNSYRSNYSRPVDIHATNFLTMTLTNDDGVSMSLNTVIGRHFAIPNATNAVWPGYNSFAPNASLIIPLKTNMVFLPDSAYLSGFGFTTNLNMGWDTSQVFRPGQWGLAISNRLAVYLVDHDSQRLLDCVLLKGLNAVRDLSEEIRDPDNALGFGGSMSTNLLAGGPPQGILNQILISLGLYGANLEDWRAYDLGAHSALDFEIDYFRALYGLSPLKYPSLVNTSLVQQVPFTPTKRLSQYVNWQANDTLVHFTLGASNVLGRENLTAPLQSIKNLGLLNDRYEPWGGNPVAGQANLSRDFNLALKDPLVRTSDDWSFPDSEPLSLAMLARVHRGTPWQTIYLKSAGIDLATWTDWSGIPDVPTALLTMPTNDWRLAGLLASLLNTNSPRQLLSINERSTSAWFAVQDGLIVLSNSLSDAQLGSINGAAQFDTNILSSNSPQAAVIAEAIARDRANRLGQAFRGLENILGTPELSTDSPWLNRSRVIQLKKGISDQAYEAIPAQLLMRLRPDSIGSISESGGGLRLGFTGFDDYPYAVEISSNLADWASVTTNYPTNGVFEFVEPTTAQNERRFYRSVLLP